MSLQSTAITAAITALVTTGVNRPGALKRAVTDRFQRPAGPLLSGGFYSGGSNNNEVIYATVRCAPVHAESFAEVKLTVAKNFARSVSSSAFTGDPRITPDGLQFGMPRRAGDNRGDLCLWNSGLIELRLPVFVEPDHEDAMSLPLTSIAEVFLSLADRIEDGAYGTLFPTRSGRRSKLNWSLAVGHSIISSGSSFTWSSIRFAHDRDVQHSAQI